MKRNKLFLLSILLMTGCNASKYNLAYEGAELILEKNYGKELMIEKCYYSNSKELNLDAHVVYEFSFINMYNQRTNRYFLYLNEDVYDESKKAKEYYELVGTSDYYIKLDVKKINDYLANI